MASLLAKENWLLWFLLFIPIALLLDHVVHAGALWVFLASSVAIIPLAALMGRATEQLAERLGEGVGGLLNATFGNAAELIIAIVALRAGLVDLVKASITGSIIGNLLLVFGASTLWGGIKFQTQQFNRTAAGLSATLLVLSAVALFIPAIFHLIVGTEAGVAERTLSVEIAVVLIVTYVLSLYFSLRTHKHLYVGEKGPHTDELTPVRSTKSAVALLVDRAGRRIALDGGRAAPGRICDPRPGLLLASTLICLRRRAIVTSHLR